MRKLFSLMGGLAVAGAALLGSSAAMADGYEKAKGKAIYEPVPYHNWGGLYVGVNAGWVGMDYSSTFDATAPNNVFGLTGRHLNGETSDTLLGLHIGLQHQFGQFVLGVEGGYSGAPRSHFDGSDTVGGGNCANTGFIAPDTCKARFHNMYQIGGRVGWTPSSHWLLFVSGGYASARISDRLRHEEPPFNVHMQSSARHDGWYLGGGVEYALTSNWIFGLEYQHLDFGSQKHCGNGDSENCVSGLGQRTGVADVDIVRARLSFKLNRPAPVYETLK